MICYYEYTNKYVIKHQVLGGKNIALYGASNSEKSKTE